jgi:lipopolysaccharide transport system permease protein
MSRVVITPPGPLSLPRWRELWGAREVLFRFGQRDVLLRYRQTAIGVVWVVLQPRSLLPLQLHQHAGLDTLQWCDRTLCPVAGQQPGAGFEGILPADPRADVDDALRYPRLPCSSGPCRCAPRGVRRQPGLGSAARALLLLLLLGLGIGIASSAIMVKYRDVAYVLPWLLMVGLYASPVAYSLDAVPANLRVLFTANPVSWLLEGFRWSMLGTPAPPLWQLVAAVVVCPSVFFAGILVFQRHERLIADLI